MKISLRTLSLSLGLMLIAASVSAEKNAKQENEKNKTDYASNVTIVRDEWGVPHIYGKTDPDVAYGLAWVSCEDNFPIVQETFLSAKGLMGIHKGKDGAIIDFFHHAIGTEKLIDEKFLTYSPEFIEYLEGYAAGLNDYAEMFEEKVLLKKLFPLDARDISRAYFVSLAFNSNVHKKIQDIVEGKFDMNEAAGSNAMAYSSTITDDGLTYLCINPHQPMEGHFSWYEAHLVSEEGLDIIGALFPGGTSIYLGTNRHLGWAHTSNNINSVDVYRLEMHPKNKLMYQFDDEWLALEERPVKLNVKLKKWMFKLPVKKSTYWSVHGPVIKSKSGDFFALRYPALMEVRAPEQWYRMNKATNFYEFKEALKMNAMPKYTITYADKNDNIFFIDNGMVPVRDTSMDWCGVLPGNTSQTVWNEWYPVDLLPQIHNPECGYVYNMNNTFAEATCSDWNIPSVYPDNMGFIKHNTNRSERFIELINQYPVLSFEDMKTIKFDKELPQSSAFISSMQNLFELDESLYPEVADILRLVKSWDKKATADSKPASVMLPMLEYIFKIKKYGSSVFGEGMYVDDEMYVDALRYTKDYLLKYFGTIEVPLAEMQRIRRGALDLPMPGFPDVLAAAYSKPAKDGRFVGWIGDSYTMFVAYDKNGPVRIESLHPYGTSSNPDSPHFNDQMSLYSKQQTKTLTMDKATIFKNAKKIYHPNNVPYAEKDAL